MDHSEAVTKRLAESYLLGELTPEQREAYEEHYFNCSECAQEIQAGAMLVANVKEVLREEPSPRVAADSVRGHAGWLSFPWLRPAYSMAALVVLLGVLVYQNAVIIPGLKSELNAGSAPRTLASFSFIPQGSRGADSLVIRAAASQPYGVYVDIPANGDFTSYVCTIQSESGVVDLSVPVSAAQAKETVQLLVPGSLLRPGKYVLVVRGNRATGNTSEAGSEIVRYPFMFEFKN
jgi:hypothetical protein